MAFVSAVAMSLHDHDVANRYSMTEWLQGSHGALFLIIITEGTLFISNYFFSIS